MKKISFILLVAVSFLLGSCANTETKNKETVAIAHAKGTSNVPKEIKKVICLDYSVLETLNQMNIEVVGVPKSNLPAHLEKYKDEKYTDVGTLLEPNFEKINELQPDVIFASKRTEKGYDELNKIAPTVYMDSDAKDFMSSIKKDWDLIAQVFGKQTETDQAFKLVEEKVSQVNTKAKEKNQKGLVLMFNKGKFSAYGKDSRFGMIYTLLGITPAVDEIEAAKHGQAISNEFIQKANPDIIYIIDRSAVVDKNASNKSEIENVLVQQTNAFKNGKIIYLNPETWYLAGSGIYSVNAMIDEISKSLD